MIEKQKKLEIVVEKRVTLILVQISREIVQKILGEEECCHQEFWRKDKKNHQE
jgi:hypothetical protein